MLILRSPLFYVGDKYKLIPQILPYFPNDINRFIEPFTGGGSVFLNVQAKKYILNDIDTNVCELHKLLIKNVFEKNKFFQDMKKMILTYNLSRSYLEDVVPDKLKKEFKKTFYAKFNKKGYDLMKADFNRSNKKDILMLYLLLIFGFNRMLRFNLKGDFNIPVGNVDFNKNVFLALNNYFDFIRDKKVEIFNFDYLDFLKQIKFKKGDFVYLDPPYLISASEYNKHWDKSKEQELLNLLDKLDEQGINFAISNMTNHKGNKNELFINWMKKHNVINISSNYISYHNNTNKGSREVLVTNYDKKRS